MVRLAGLPTKYTMLLVGTQSHSRGEEPVETCLQDLGLLLNSQGQEQGHPGAGLHCAPTLNASTRMPSSLTNYHTRTCGSNLFS